jgi:hypothetical protein
MDDGNILGLSRSFTVEADTLWRGGKMKFQELYRTGDMVREEITAIYPFRYSGEGVPDPYAYSICIGVSKGWGVYIIDIAFRDEEISRDRWQNLGLKDKEIVDLVVEPGDWGECTIVAATTEGLFYLEKKVNRTSSWQPLFFVEDGKIDKARRRMGVIDAALELYKVDNGTYPATLTLDTLAEIAGYLENVSAILDTFENKRLTKYESTGSGYIFEAVVKDNKDTVIRRLTDDAFFYVSLDGGTSWTSVESIMGNLPRPTKLGMIVRFWGGGESIFVGTTNGVWKGHAPTISQIDSFIRYGLQGTEITALEMIVKGDVHHLIAGTAQGEVFTKVGESGWQKIFTGNSGVTAVAVKAIPESNQYAFYIATENNGVVYGESSFYPIQPLLWSHIDLSEHKVFDLSVDPDNYKLCYAATDKGIYKYYPLPISFTLSYSQATNEVIFTLKNISERDIVKIEGGHYFPCWVEIYNKNFQRVKRYPRALVEAPRVIILAPNETFSEEYSLNNAGLTEGKYFISGEFESAGYGNIPASPLPLEIEIKTRIDNISSISSENRLLSFFANPRGVNQRLDFEAQNLKVKLYNILGQEIEAKVNLPAGVYFYQLSVNNKVIGTKKFLHLK